MLETLNWRYIQLLRFIQLQNSKRAVQINLVTSKLLWILSIGHLQICQQIYCNFWDDLHLWLFVDSDYNLWHFVNASDDSRLVYSIFVTISLIFRITENLFDSVLFFLVARFIKCIRNNQTNFANILVICANLCVLWYKRICDEPFQWNWFLQQMWLVYISSNRTSSIANAYR